MRGREMEIGNFVSHVKFLHPIFSITFSECIHKLNKIIHILLLFFVCALSMCEKLQKTLNHLKNFAL